MPSKKKRRGKPVPVSQQQATTSRAGEPDTSRAGEPDTSRAGEPGTSRAGEPGTSRAGEGTSRAGEPATQRVQAVDVSGHAQIEQDTEHKAASSTPKTRMGAPRKARKELHTTVEQLGIHLEQSLTLRAALVKRPDYGTRGRKIGLSVNYFPVELPSGNVYHYDVEITLKRRESKEGNHKMSESKEKKFLCMNTKKNREVINALVHTNHQFRGYFPAYDGRKNLYTKHPLPFTKLSAFVELTNTSAQLAEDPLPRGDVYEVSIQPVVKKETSNNAVNLDTLHALYQGKTNVVPQETVMAIETILRNGPCFKYVPLGRSFFYPPLSPEDEVPLGSGKEIWFGYHQSLILAEWKPVVNINVTASTFYKSGPVIDYVCEVLGCTPEDLYRTPQLRDADRVLLSKKLKGLRVKVTHLSYEREYRVIKLTRQTAKQLEFTIDRNGGAQRKTVFQFFLEKYKLKLKYDHLPCLHVHPEQKNVYLPMEVCNVIRGQHSNERMTESQTSDMIRVASLRPDDRARKIRDVLRLANFNNDPCNEHFGIRVSPTPLSIEGRVIDPPNVMYFNQRCVRPKDGSWEIKPEKFFRGADIKSWVLLSLVNNCSMDDLNKFANLLCSVGRDYGLSIQTPKAIDICSRRNMGVGKVLTNIREKFCDLQLAVVVVQGKSSPYYPEIKQVAETILGLVTQCVQGNNVKRLNRAVAGNICQKINAKMDGINSSLTPGEKPAIFNKPVIIIGADVTHPAPGSFSKPSIAAAVASLDSCPSRYAVSFRAQRCTDNKKHSVEIITDLENMVKELLSAFFKNTRKKPEKIIFYRDGVSEGEFVKVRNHELQAIQNACQSLEANYRPGITFIVVQKRHHTRFFPQDQRDGVGPKRNVPPGTVVDRGASSRIHFDFFLCSHFGLQGTSRPGHYTVISDDNKFTSDELQKLTYYLCHIYARCTRSISIPAPVQYAHLAAARAAKYLAAELDESSGSSEISDAEFRVLQNTWERILAVRPELINKLYFV